MNIELKPVIDASGNDGYHLGDAKQPYIDAMYDTDNDYYKDLRDNYELASSRLTINKVRFENKYRH